MSPNLRLVHRTFTSKVQLRQANVARPLASLATGNETTPGPSSLLRTATFNGVTCTVVPIIALTGDIIVWAANSPVPELVPLYCLESLPLAAWNGRPIVPLHPRDDQGFVLASSPDVLDKWQFGLTFNAALTNKALSVEGYLNPVRAASVGQLANDVLTRIATDEIVEVSVGVSVLVSDTKGVIANADGTTTEYEAVWEQLLYIDHLAMLPAGVQGACSVESGGCGAPRVNDAPRVNNNATITPAVLGGGLEMGTETETTKAAETPAAVPGEIFYGNMRDKLRTALYDLLTAQIAAQVPAPGESTDDLEEDAEELYVWVVDYSNKSVIYEKGPSYERFKRSYSIDSAGKIVLADDEVEVTTEQVYKPASGFAGLMGKIKTVIAQAMFGEEGASAIRTMAGARHSAKDQMMIQTIHDHARDLGAGCATEDDNKEGDGYTVKPMEAARGESQSAAPCSCKGGSKVAMTKDEKTALVTKILAAPASTWKEDQRGVLEATDEAVLQVLAGATPIDPDGGKPKEVKTEVAQAATPAATSAPLTPEQWWAQAPPEMADVRALANRAKEAEKTEKDTLVRALSTAQEAFTEDQLKAMDLTGLHSLASLTGLFLPKYDYTGAMGSLSRDAASSTEAKETQVYLNPPKPFDLMRAAKSKSTGKPASGNSTSPEAN